MGFLSFLKKIGKSDDDDDKERPPKVCIDCGTRQHKGMHMGQCAECGLGSCAGCGRDDPRGGGGRLCQLCWRAYQRGDLDDHHGASSAYYAGAHTKINEGEGRAQETDRPDFDDEPPPPPSHCQDGAAARNGHSSGARQPSAESLLRHLQTEFNNGANRDATVVSKSASEPVYSFWSTLLLQGGLGPATSNVIFTRAQQGLVSGVSNHKEGPASAAATPAIPIWFYDAFMSAMSRNSCQQPNGVSGNGGGGGLGGGNTANIDQALIFQDAQRRLSAFMQYSAAAEANKALLLLANEAPSLSGGDREKEGIRQQDDDHDAHWLLSIATEIQAANIFNPVKEYNHHGVTARVTPSNISLSALLFSLSRCNLAVSEHFIIRMALEISDVLHFLHTSGASSAIVTKERERKAAHGVLVRPKSVSYGGLSPLTVILTVATTAEDAHVNRQGQGRAMPGVGDDTTKRVLSIGSASLSSSGLLRFTSTDNTCGNSAHTTTRYLPVLKELKAIGDNTTLRGSSCDDCTFDFSSCRSLLSKKTGRTLQVSGPPNGSSVGASCNLPDRCDGELFELLLSIQKHQEEGVNCGGGHNATDITLYSSSLSTCGGYPDDNALKDAAIHTQGNTSSCHLFLPFVAPELVTEWNGSEMDGATNSALPSNASSHTTTTRNDSLKLAHRPSTESDVYSLGACLLALMSAQSNSDLDQMLRGAHTGSCSRAAFASCFDTLLSTYDRQRGASDTPPLVQGAQPPHYGCSNTYYNTTASCSYVTKYSPCLVSIVRRMLASDPARRPTIIQCRDELRLLRDALYLASVD